MSKYTDELLDEKFSNINDDIKEIKNDTKTIKEICVSVKEIAMETKELRKDFNKVDERLSSIEKEPGENWKKVSSYIITTVVGAVITYILVKIGLK